MKNDLYIHSKNLLCSNFSHGGKVAIDFVCLFVRARACVRAKRLVSCVLAKRLVDYAIFIKHGRRNGYNCYNMVKWGEMSYYLWGRMFRF